jgi:hypothetical protein
MSQGGESVQVLGDRPAGAREVAPPKWALALFVLAGVATIAVFAAVGWIAQPPDEEGTLRDFAAAVDAGDEERARSYIGDATIISWPTYWSVLNIEHISPFGDRLGDFIDFQHELRADTEIRACETRPTGPEEPDEYDKWVRCDYFIRDALSQRLQGPSGSSTGRLSVGFKDGLIRTVFVIRTDRPAVLGHFREWVNATFPDVYAGLLDQPAVLQLDVPIIGLVVTDYNAGTAATLIAFADSYASAGFPTG